MINSSRFPLNNLISIIPPHSAHLYHQDINPNKHYDHGPPSENRSRWPRPNGTTLRSHNFHALPLSNNSNRASATFTPCCTALPERRLWPCAAQLPTKSPGQRKTKNTRSLALKLIAIIMRCFLTQASRQFGSQPALMSMRANLWQRLRRVYMFFARSR